VVREGSGRLAVGLGYLRNKRRAMKVVVNRCFGGFGLSMKAQREYLKRKGKEAYFYKMEGATKYVRIDDVDRKPWLFCTVTEDMGKEASDLPDDAYFSHYNVERTDPDLIAVVEELGDEANGEHARLEVVEVPDGIAWELEDYDGNETIEEVHRSW
jgi:hypothetical protein